VSSCVYKKCNNGVIRFVCLVCVCPPFFARGTEAKLQTLILQKHTHQQEDAEHHLLSDKTYSTPNEQNPNSHLLSLPTTKMSTKLHNSVTRIFLVFLSRFSPPLSRSPRALSLSLSLSLSPSLPPCGKLQTLIALGLVCPSLGQCRAVIRKRKGGGEGHEK
jgi:hypothetical protein